MWGYSSKRIGEGNRVRFWVDDWLRVSHLREFSLSCLGWHQTNGLLLSYAEEGGSVSWVVPFRRALRRYEVSLYESLFSLLSNVFLSRGEEDSRIWMSCSSGVFSSRFLYKSLEEMPREGVPNFCQWHDLAPPRMEAFCWLAVLGKVSIVDNLRIRRLRTEDFSDLCSLCGKETIDHLFVQ